MVFGSLFPEEDGGSKDFSVLAQSIGAEVRTVFHEYAGPQVGRIRRIKPFHPEDLLTPAVQALKRNLDEQGITEFAPKFYEMRAERMYKAGMITQGGLGFTEKGKAVIKKYFSQRGVSDKAADAKTLKSALVIQPDRGAAAQGKLKYAFGYQLDNRGMTMNLRSPAPAKKA